MLLKSLYETGEIQKEEGRKERRDRRKKKVTQSHEMIQGPFFF